MTVPGTPNVRRAAAFAVLAMLAAAAPLQGAEQWIEVKSAHFVVTSNAGQGSAKTIAWQLEQVRSAIVSLYQWAKVDLNKPLTVLAVKDETSMKALAPHYWEVKGGVRPASVWVGGEDQNFLLVRTDVDVSSQGQVNPYITAYFSYVNMILQQSLRRDLPPWFTRGLTGVLSNVLIRDAKVVLGSPISWHLQRLRDTPRLKLRALIAVDRNSPEFTSDEGLRTFDAESWLLVHFLMFGENGAHAGALDKFVQMAMNGTDPGAAFAEAIGKPEDLETPFGNYVGRSIFGARQLNVDVTVKPEGFTVRQLPVTESSSRRALFHAAMNRPVEARAAIAEARKAGAAPDSFVAEALLLDREGKTAEAKAAFERATKEGCTDGYAYYRLASIMWRPGSDPDTLKQVEALYSKAVELNTNDAWGYASLGDVRSILAIGDPLSLVLRAIRLEPSEPWHHMRAANVLWRQRKFDEATTQAQAALDLAKDDDTRRQAREMLDDLKRAKGGKLPIQARREQ